MALPLDATATASADNAIQLTKSATLQLGADNKLQAGDTVLYSFVIQNIGNVTLTGVDLDDTLLGFSDATCGQATLAPAASTSCTATYTLTQADIDAGSVANTATACGTPPAGADVCDDDSTSTPLGANKAIQLTKSATLQLGADNKLQAGDTVLYSFVIQNIGNVTLTGVDLDDTLLGFSDATCGQATLAPAASTSCTATYTLTQADIDAGSVANTATACGTPPAGADVRDDDSTSTPLGPTAVTVHSITAKSTHRGTVVRWITASEFDTLGFHVYRQGPSRRIRISARLIPAKGHDVYTFLDRSGARTKTSRYWVQAVGLNGSRTWYGPVRVTFKSA
jgi:hypothetical protein